MAMLKIPARTRPILTLVLMACLLLGPAVHTLAQTSPSGATITTIGYGKASAPAETALLQMLISREDYAPLRAPDPDATPGAAELESVGPVVSSLNDVQVPSEDIEVVVGSVINTYYAPAGRGIAMVEVRIDAPTHERITELIDAATVGAARRGLMVGMIGVGYGVSDCTALEIQAREAALANAWTQGEMQAELMGLALGDPIAATDLPSPSSLANSMYYGLYSPTNSACLPALPAVASGSPITTALYDPTTAVEVSAFAQVSVTFSASPAGSATPAA